MVSHQYRIRQPTALGWNYSGGILCLTAAWRLFFSIFHPLARCTQLKFEDHSPAVPGPQKFVGDILLPSTPDGFVASNDYKRALWVAVWVRFECSPPMRRHRRKPLSTTSTEAPGGDLDWKVKTGAMVSELLRRIACDQTLKRVQASRKVSQGHKLHSTVWYTVRLLRVRCGEGSFH